MIDIIHFSMTVNPVVNYVTDVAFTVFIYAIPIKLIGFTIHRATKWF
jgi:hypothetical protein